MWDVGIAIEAHEVRKANWTFVRIIINEIVVKRLLAVFCNLALTICMPVI